MIIHKDVSPLAGKTVKVKNNVHGHGGKDFEVKDWWDRCAGYSWMSGIANPVCTTYAVRASFSARTELFNNDVLYGKIGNFMYLIHVSELEETKASRGT